MASNKKLHNAGKAKDRGSESAGGREKGAKQGRQPLSVAELVEMEKQKREAKSATATSRSRFSNIFKPVTRGQVTGGASPEARSETSEGSTQVELGAKQALEQELLDVKMAAFGAAEMRPGTLARPSSDVLQQSKRPRIFEERPSVFDLDSDSSRVETASRSFFAMLKMFSGFSDADLQSETEVAERIRMVETYPKLRSVGDVVYAFTQGRLLLSLRAFWRDASRPNGTGRTFESFVFEETKLPKRRIYELMSISQHLTRDEVTDRLNLGKLAVLAEASSKYPGGWPELKPKLPAPERLAELTRDGFRAQLSALSKGGADRKQGQRNLGGAVASAVTRVASLRGDLAEVRARMVESGKQSEERLGGENLLRLVDAVAIAHTLAEGTWEDIESNDIRNGATSGRTDASALCIRRATALRAIAAALDRSPLGAVDAADVIVMMGHFVPLLEVMAKAATHARSGISAPGATVWDVSLGAKIAQSVDELQESLGELFRTLGLSSPERASDF